MTPGKGGCDSTEVEHIDRPQQLEKRAVNAGLIVACTVFAAASFIFGYDDKLISPVIALPAFVRCPSTLCSRELFADPVV